MTEIPEGTDANKLFVDQSTSEVVIEYKGENWRFTVRPLSWKEKGDAMTAATKLDITGSKKGKKTKSVRMDMPAYNTAYLMKAIVKAPFAVNMASFMKLDGEFGDLLVDAIVDPEGRDEDEEGNSETMLEV